MKYRFTWLAISACCAALLWSCAADVLVLREGPRVDGQLISVRDGRRRVRSARRRRSRAHACGSRAGAAN